MLGFPDCEEERACCLALMNVLLLSRGCQWSVSLSRGAMGWSVKWDSDISLYTQYTNGIKVTYYLKLSSCYLDCKQMHLRAANLKSFLKRLIMGFTAAYRCIV